MYYPVYKNILDYCGQNKTRGSWSHVNTGVIKGIHFETPIQKTLRYYVSISGTKIIKLNDNDKRRINVVAGRWMQTVFNKFEEKEWDEYNIDIKFYLDRIDRELKTMRPDLFINQYTLF